MEDQEVCEAMVSELGLKLMSMLLKLNSSKKACGHLS